MSAIKIIQAFAKKSLTKDKGSGITTLPSQFMAESKAGEIAAILQQAGIPINQLDDFIRSEADLLKFLNIIESTSKPRVIPGSSAEGKAITEKLFGKKGEVVDMTGKNIDTSQGIMGGKSVKELMDSGQVQKGTEGLKKSEKITNRDLFKDANQRLRGPIKGKMDMGPFGKVNVETDYSAAINRKEFFDSKAKNMYDKTVKTGPEFFKAQKEQILNTINRKKKEMVPTTHSNYKLLKKSLNDQEDALEAIKVTEDLGGNENMFDFLRTQNIADYKSKPLKRSNYTKTDAELKAKFDKDNQDSIQRFKDKMKDDPEDMADGGVAGLLGERPGYVKGLKVQGSGSISGKNQIQGAPEGITSNKSFINLIANLDIPISEKINLLGDVQYSKFRDKIEKGDEELFIEDPGSFLNKKIGVGINQGNEGFSGSAKYDVDSGEPEFKILFKKSFAQGGPARQNFKMGRRAFLGLMGSVGAGIAGLKSGLLRFGGKQATKQVAKELTSVPIGNPEGMPAWFKPLVNKIIKEGDDVTKKFGTVDREIVHTKKIDKFEEVTVYQDLNTGNVRLEYGPHLTDDTGKVIRGSNEPTVVQLEYKAPEVLEPNLTTGKGGGKTKEEFYAAESEPEIVNWDGDIEMSGINEVNKVDDLITDTSKLQKYATDNKLTIKELSDSMKKQKYKNKLDSDLGEQVNYIENKSGMNAMDYIDEGTRVGDFDPKGYRNYDTKGINLPEKKASGGIARMLGE